jgi:hypothetical protein
VDDALISISTVGRCERTDRRQHWRKHRPDYADFVGKPATALPFWRRGSGDGFPMMCA